MGFILAPKEDSDVPPFLSHSADLESPLVKGSISSVKFLGVGSSLV